jgi:F0F1-type ATP synthase assembly protein I
MNKRRTFQLFALGALIMFFAGVFSEPTSWALIVCGLLGLCVSLIISESEFEDRLK